MSVRQGFRSVPALLQRRTVARMDGGQSLIEVALVVPLLLLIVIGATELGRAFSYNVTLQNAVREGAAYGARSLTATDASVSQRVCDSTGWSHSGSCTDLVVVVTRNGVDSTIVDA